MTPTKAERQRGCLLGLAIADALGAAVEFQRPGTFSPVAEYRAGGPHGLGPGEWTDDTSLALALADSIVQAGWDLNDQVRRYVSWWKTGRYSVNGRCFDIGITTRSALSRFERTGNARTSGDPSEHASGNGSIMRLAPVPIGFADLFPDNLIELVRLAAESSLPTHASPQCLSACRYMALVLAGLIHGLDRDEVLSPTWEPLRRLRAIEPLHPEVEAVAAGSFRDHQPPVIKGSGYVVKSLEAALWAFHDAESFEEAALRAINLGDDADTTGAVCGQIAGAYWGESGIPQEWRDDLAQREMIEDALTGLLNRRSSPSQTSSSNVKPERFPSRPEFLTSNAANKTKNESAVDRALQLAHRGDVGALKGMVLPPSPKLEAWHKELVREVERRVSAAPPVTPPTASSYWVVPRRLLAGAYPGAPTPAAHRKKVSDLVAAGVRVFVSLMEMGETNHHGEAFVPYEDLVRELQPQATCVRFPIRDLSVPSTADMAATLDAIDRFLDAGKTVYVHCWGGVGRTGTVIACWLLRHQRATTDNVIATLAALRRQDEERGHRDSPESTVQCDFVRNWSEVGTAERPSAVPKETGTTEADTLVRFRPTPAAEQALNDLVARFPWMEGFRDGPFGKNHLTTTESALWSATYEIRSLLGGLDSVQDASARLANIWELLTDGVLRSLVLSRGGVDWTESE